VNHIHVYMYITVHASLNVFAFATKHQYINTNFGYACNMYLQRYD